MIEPTATPAVDPLAAIHPSVRPWRRIVTMHRSRALRNPASARDHMDESLRRLLGHIAEHGLPKGTDPNIVLHASLALAYRQALLDAREATQVGGGDR